MGWSSSVSVGDSSVLMDLHWPCSCTTQSSILSIGSVSVALQLQKCHWSDTDEEHSCCTRRLECKKWAEMLVETGKVFVASGMMTQMREDSDFGSLPALTTVCWRTHLVITKHPDDGHGIAQMDKTTTRLITFLWGSASDQEWTLPEHEVFQEQTLEVITTCWWWPFAFLKKISKPKTHKTKFDLEKLKDPNVLETFQAMVGGKF